MEIPCPRCNNDMKIISRTEVNSVLVSLTIICPTCQKIYTLWEEDYFKIKGEKNHGTEKGRSGPATEIPEGRLQPSDAIHGDSRAE